MISLFLIHDDASIARWIASIHASASAMLAARSGNSVAWRREGGEDAAAAALGPLLPPSLKRTLRVTTTKSFDDAASLAA